MRYLALFAVVAVAACGSPQKATGSGDTCFRDDDCEYGLVCAAPSPGAGRVCTADVSGLISEVDAEAGGATNLDATGTAGSD